MPRKEKAHETLIFWKRRYEKAQRYEDAHIASKNRVVPVEYLEWLGLAEYVAISGLARAGISAGFHGHSAARALVEAEQRHLKRRAAQLRDKLDRLVDQAPDEHGFNPAELEDRATHVRTEDNIDELDEDEAA